MGFLDGKAAFVTGAASGIGRGAALRFAAEGAQVALADIQDTEPIRAEIEEIGGSAISVFCDVASDESVREAVAKSVSAFAKIDTVFACAGINGVWAPVDDLTVAEWDRTMSVNLRGTFLTVHHAVPQMKRNATGGSIIICSSVNGNRIFTMPGASAYSTSKAAQVTFMKMIAVELGHFKIRVNAICPGAIHTNIGASTTIRNTAVIDTKVRVENMPTLGKGSATPMETGDVCVFLASDLSRHVSGVEIYVDGGASLVR